MYIYIYTRRKRPVNRISRVSPPSYGRKAYYICINIKRITSHRCFSDLVPRRPLSSPSRKTYENDTEIFIKLRRHNINRIRVYHTRYAVGILYDYYYDVKLCVFTACARVCVPRRTIFNAKQTFYNTSCAASKTDGSCCITYYCF